MAAALPQCAQRFSHESDYLKQNCYTNVHEYTKYFKEITNMSELIMYRETDLETCAEIYVDAFNAPPLEYNFLTKEKAERYLRDLTRTPGFMGYTYWVDGEMAAFCFGKLDNYFEGMMFEVEELAVVPQKHRSGLGSIVMSLLETKLAGYGVMAVSLHTSRDLPAFGFYIKNNYEELSENVTLMKWLQ
jgi:ribosomal protein S18 acetylase RimI-like enzyme